MVFEVTVGKHNLMRQFSIRLARLSASLYAISDEKPPDQENLMRYSLNSCSDSNGPAKWLGMRTLLIAVPSREHILFPPHGFGHPRISSR